MISRNVLFSAHVALLLMACAAEPPVFVTYEQHGAVGDGKTDDRAAIVAAHADANAKGQPVRARDGATYYMGCDGRAAIVRTDVDFGTAKFVIDDSHVAKRHVKTPAFSIAPDLPPFAVTGIVALAKGQKELGVRLPGRCVVKLTNDRVKRFIRYGSNQNNGSPQQEIVLADGEGRIDAATPLVWDYDVVTAAKAYPIPERTLTVRGGTFTTIANQAESKYNYYLRGIDIHRSNVCVEGLRHLVTGELDHGAPYSGFIRIRDCSDVTVTGCVFTARRTYGTIGSAGRPVKMGSYGITVESAANVRFIGCRQTTDILDGRYWGLFGSNYCRNLLFDDCAFSRFDAHAGVANATIRNSTLGYMGIKAIGFGTLIVENTTVKANGPFIGLRSDYGSSWDGDIVIRNCVYAPYGGKAAETPIILNGSNVGAHDFGYACRMPRRMVIDGLDIDDSACKADKGHVYIFGAFNRNCKGDGVRPYPLTETVTLRNVRIASGRPLKTSPDAERFKDLRIVRE